jgi:hypothetical protein
VYKISDEAQDVGGGGVRADNNIIIWFKLQCCTRVQNGFIWLGIENSRRPCWYSNGHSVSIKDRLMRHVCTNNCTVILHNNIQTCGKPPTCFGLSAIFSDVTTCRTFSTCLYIIVSYYNAVTEACATSRNVAISIPDCVTGTFHWHNPSGRSLVLGSTQPLTEMSNRNISWGGKGAQCVGLTTLPPSCVDCLEIWEPQPPGTLSACTRIALPLTLPLPLPLPDCCIYGNILLHVTWTILNLQINSSPADGSEVYLKGEEK